MFCVDMTTAFRGKMKARLHRRFLLRQLDVIFVAIKLHHESFKHVQNPGDIAKSHLVYTCDFEVATSV